MLKMPERALIFVSFIIASAANSPSIRVPPLTLARGAPEDAAHKLRAPR